MSHHFYSNNRRIAKMRGFTLIELLVAISLMAIVLASIYGVFTSMNLTKRRLDGDSADYHLARVLYDRMGREIEGTFFSSDDPRAVFRGGKNSSDEDFLELTTTAVTPQGGDNSSISHVRYLLTPNQETGPGYILWRSERSKQASSEDEPEMIRMAMGLGEWAIRFRSDNRWYENWDASSQGLPEMVEIRLVIDTTDAHQKSFISSFVLQEFKKL